MSLFTSIRLAGKPPSDPKEHWVGTSALYEMVDISSNRTLPQIEDPIEEGSMITLPRSKTARPGLFTHENMSTVRLLVEQLPLELLEVLRTHLLDRRPDAAEDVARVRMLEAFLDPQLKIFHPKVTSGKFSYEPGMLLQTDWVDTEDGPECVEYPVCTGSLGEILDFIYESHPGRYAEVVATIRQQSNFDQEIFEEGWHEMLSAYRRERSSNKSMDKMTKISQNEFIDQDHQVFDFGSPIYPDNHQYVTSDNERPEVPWALSMAYPALKTQVPDPDEIWANVVVGDMEGATSNDKTKLEELYNKYQANRELVIRVKMYMDENLDPKYRGMFVRKPRAHNLVVVMEFDEESPPMLNFFKAMVKKVARANHARNMRYYSTVQVAARRNVATTREYFQLFRGRVELGKTPTCFPVKSKLKTVENKRAEARMQRYLNICRDEMSLHYCRKNHWPFCKINGDFYGRLEYCDIGFGSPEFVFASLVHWVEDRGGTLKFDGFTWEMQF